MKKSLIKSYLAFGLVVSMLFSTTTGMAAIRTWTGAISSNWNTAGNWSGAIVPTSADDVIIPTSTPNFPIVTTVLTSVDNIRIDIGGQLTINSGSLSATDHINVNGTLTINGGLLSTAFDLQGSGTTNVNGGTFTVTRDIIGDGSMNISGGTISTRNFNHTGAKAGSLISMNAGVFQVSHDWGPGEPSMFVPTGGLVQFTGDAGGTTAFPINGVYNFFNVQVDVSHPGFDHTININGTLSLNAQVVLPGGITMTANGLILGGIGQVGGTWGSTASPATHQNNTSFSGTGILTVSTNLLIELINFKGYEDVGKSHLRWSTVSELKNKKFIIERSTDKNRYLSIGEVPGSGTSPAQKDYTFTDKSPLTGFNYYRLKQEDFDGKFDYSKTIGVKIEWKERGISIFPIPATHTVNLSLSSDHTGTADLFFYDFLGRQVKTQSLPIDGQPFQIKVDLSSLPPGMYIMTVKAGPDNWQERLLVN